LEALKIPSCTEAFRSENTSSAKRRYISIASGTEYRRRPNKMAMSLNRC
jgi:hypothetical protein